MEDEECLYETSSLKAYLQNLGFSDFHIAKKNVQNPASIRFEASKTKTEWDRTETIDKDIIDKIGIIISTQMLFEEDVLKVEKLLSNFEVVKNSMLKFMIKDLFGKAVMLIGLCLYWVIGYYAFALVSSFYAYNAAYYLKQKYFSQFRINKLSTVIQENFKLVKKIINFIEENKLIELNTASISNSKKFLDGFDLYNNFKNDFLLYLNEITDVFINATQKLISKVPLNDYIENPQYYLCNNFKKDYESIDLSKLYKIYLLLQSEFLQRLILSLIPNIKLSPNDDFNEINKILTETCIELLKVRKIINKKFKFFFFNGIYSQKTKVEIKLPKKNGLSSDIYKQELFLGIHETSNDFQKLLLKSRILEESIQSKKTVEYLEDELVQIQNNLNCCQRNLNDILMLLKRSNLKNTCDKIKVQKKVQKFENSNEKLSKIVVGRTDLDPEMEDEIFELYLTYEKADRDFSDYDDWDLFEKKMEKEYVKNVMRELKVKLLEKAKDWKKREREVLKKKGLIDETNVMLENESKSTEEEKANQFDVCMQFGSHNMPPNFKTDYLNTDNLKKKKEKFDSENFLIESRTVDSSNLENCISVKNSEEETVTLQAENLNSGSTQIFDRTFKTNFFNDLNQTRQKIFKSFAIDEVLFCDSEEESSRGEDPR